MFQLEYIPWAVLVRSGRDVVGASTAPQDLNPKLTC